MLASASPMMPATRASGPGESEISTRMRTRRPSRTRPRKITDDKSATTKSSVLYESYKLWAETAGERALSNRALALELQNRGYRKEHNDKGTIFIGLKL